MVVDLLPIEPLLKELRTVQKITQGQEFLMPTPETMAICNGIQNIHLQLRREQITATLNLQVVKATDRIIHQGAPASRLLALAQADLQVHHQQVDLLHHPDHLSQVV